jgi:antitoxin ParD1/3/4
MDIALPESLERLVRRRVEEGGYASAEEYVRDLILADQEPTSDWQDLSESERQEVERINRLLPNSLDSGPPVVADDAFWEGIKQRVREGRALGA